MIVSWTDYKYSPYAWTGDAFICRSTDNGETWGQPVQMTDLHLVKATDISAARDTVLLVYSDFRYGDREIMANVSYDGGLTWEGEERLTDAPGHSIEPSCEIRGDIGHATWCDARNNPDMNIYEVYYKRGDLQTGISDTARHLPLTVWKVNNYPNPFNSYTTITLIYSEGGEAYISIYNLSGELVTTLKTREGKVNWDATDALGNKVSSGVYFARASGADYNNAIKLLYLK